MCRYAAFQAASVKQVLLNIQYSEPLRMYFLNLLLITVKSNDQNSYFSIEKIQIYFQVKKVIKIFLISKKELFSISSAYVLKL